MKLESVSRIHTIQRSTGSTGSGTTGNEIMAGPEDSTSASSHHHHHHQHDHHHYHHNHRVGSGQWHNPDPLRLQGSDVVSEQECELADRLLNNLKPQDTQADSEVEAASSTMRPGDDNLRIDFRNGNAIKRSSIEQTGLKQASSTNQTDHIQTSSVEQKSSSLEDDKDSEYSETTNSEQCERKISTQSMHSDSDSVFGSADTHEHMFFIEADDEDEDNVKDLDDDGDDDADDEDSDGTGFPFSPVYHDDDDFEKENRARGEGSHTTTHTDSTNLRLILEEHSDEHSEEHSEDSSEQPAGVEGGPKRSPPRPIQRRASTSSMVTVCRHSHSSHLLVRCQMQHCDNKTAASCPAFFSPLWPEALALSSRAEHGAGASGGASRNSDRRRRYTVGSKREQQRRGEPLQSDPRKPGFMGRGRSYSDSDVQRLLMMEVGKELRKISDEFHHFYSGKGKLTTVSETASEEDYGPEV